MKEYIKIGGEITVYTAGELMVGRFVKTDDNTAFFVADNDSPKYPNEIWDNDNPINCTTLDGKDGYYVSMEDAEKNIEISFKVSDDALVKEPEEEDKRVFWGDIVEVDCGGVHNYMLCAFNAESITNSGKIQWHFHLTGIEGDGARLTDGVLFDYDDIKYDEDNLRSYLTEEQMLHVTCGRDYKIIDRSEVFK